jgi:hypothetical protein
MILRPDTVTNSLDLQAFLVLPLIAVIGWMTASAAMPAIMIEAFSHILISLSWALPIHSPLAVSENMMTKRVKLRP